MPTLQPGISIETLGECLRHRHGVAAFCPRCRRWTELDLAALVARGHGEVPLNRYRTRCRVCASPGQIQLRAPAPAWRGPASHGGAGPIPEPPAAP